MPDSRTPDHDRLNKQSPTVIKGVPVAGQAEQLVRARREITRVEEMTRIEKIEHEAQLKAEALINEASAKAEAIINEAQAQADGIRSKARSDGDLTAKREALQKLAGLISTLEKEINAIRAARAEFLKYNIKGIVDLSCAIAQKVLLSEIRRRPAAIAERARTLLERMPPYSKVTLTTSSDDIEVIERYLHEAGGPSDIIAPALRSDPSMPSGHIRLESDSGRIDAGLLNVLEELGSILSEQSSNCLGADIAPMEGNNAG